MQFLIDADLPAYLVTPFRDAGHSAVHVASYGLGTAEDPVIASYAVKNGLALITGDSDFSDLRNYPPRKYAGIVVLIIPVNMGGKFIRFLIDRFLAELPQLGDIRGKLVIVEANRIRVRS